MFFSKEYLVDLYGKMATLYSGVDIDAQGGTQFVSELKYFFATDEFMKKFNRECDTRGRIDKDGFIECVGSMVFLSSNTSGLPFGTINFSKSFVEKKDYNVGSNFFSVNVVKNSLSSDNDFHFPNRHPVLLLIKDGKVSVDHSGYDNLAKSGDYLGESLHKYAILFLWLNRFSDFSSEEKVYQDGLSFLKGKYSIDMVGCLRWEQEDVKKEIESLLKGVGFGDSPAYLFRNDLEKAEVLPFHRNRLIFGAPGTGKSHKLVKDARIHSLSQIDSEFHDYLQKLPVEKSTFNQDYKPALEKMNRSGFSPYGLTLREIEGIKEKMQSENDVGWNPTPSNFI